MNWGKTMTNYLRFIVFFILISTGILFSQWSTDPNNTLIVGYGLDPHICSDSAGGCYISYDYDNIYYPRKLGLERLDRYGYKPWGTLKQITGEFPQQYKAQIVEDGEGGVIVSYTDQYEGSPSYIYNVRVQRIDSSGNFLWGQTGVRVTLDGINNSQQQIVSDGEGGAVVEWINSSAEYKINRISDEGQRMWGDSGIVLGTNGYYDPVEIVRTTNNKYVANAERNVYRYIDGNGNIYNTINVTLGYIIPDDGGGIVLSGRVWSGMIPNLVTQRKDSLGNDLWQEPYVEIADSLDINTQLYIKYNAGFIYYSWSGMKNGIEKVAQLDALRLDGTKLFPAGSIQIGVPPLGAAAIFPLELNKTALIYANTDSLLVQTYDTLGNKLWDTSGVLISRSPIGYQSYTTDGKSGFIIAGTKEQFTVVAQQVNKYGQLGNVIIPVELISFNAEEENNKVKLTWITATETNNWGFNIERLTESLNESWERIGFLEGNGTTTEAKSYSFINNNVAEGTYKYRLKQIDYDGTFKYSKEIEVEVNYSPKEYILYQNYPNPFNSTTIIKYQIPGEGRVRINLYNILGEKIKTLYQGERNKGEYTLVVSSDELSSGAYFYSLGTNSSRTVKKLIILK